LLDVTISSIASVAGCEFYALVGDITRLIWVPFSGIFQVESFGYTPVSFYDEDVKERCPLGPGFIVQYQTSIGAVYLDAVYGGADCGQSPYQKIEILCYNI
jgi:hypothetical protein